VRAFVPLIAGILRMPARQFYAANTLSAVIWAPAHVFPGVMLAIVASLAGAVPDQCSLKTPSTGVHVNWEFAGQMTIAANGINRRWMKLQWHVNLIGQISVRKDDGRRR